MEKTVVAEQPGTMLNELEDLLDGMTDTQRERVAKAVAAIRLAHKADTQASEQRIIAAVKDNVAEVEADRHKHDKRIIHAAWEILQNVVAVVKRLQQ